LVLSLGFILAFIGAAVALLVGILIFGDVSEAIVCPAPASGPVVVNGTEALNQGTYGSSADGKYYESDVQESFISVSGAINQGAYQTGAATEAIQGEMRFGTPSQWGFLHRANVGSNITSINFWLKGDVDGAPEYPILQNIEEPSDDSNEFYLFTQGSALRFFIYEDSSTIVASGGLGANSRPPDDSNWHMVSIIMNKGNDTGVDDLATMWLDGVRIVNTGQATAGNPFTGTGADSDQGLIVGSEKGQSATTENGFALDDLTVWNGYQLTQSDIDDLYNGGSGSSAGATGENISPSTQRLHITFDTFSVGSGGSSGQGSEQCESAKDTAWTVIGILPVALFFALFAIFGALGRPQG